MAAQIRQEINILDTTLTSGTSLVYFLVAAAPVALLDTTQYNGTITYYFEVVAKNTHATNAYNVRLYNSSDGTVATISIPANTTADTLFRSSGFSPISGRSHTINVDGTAIAGQVVVKSARIVIVQNATTLTNTETQIEIGNYNTGRTAESATILTNPKYWLYTAANWDGTKTFYAEAVYDSGSMDTVTIGIYESTSITAPSWSLNATIVSAAETTTPTRTRVAFTPVDGRWYTIFSHNGSMDDHDIYRAGVVVQQADGSSGVSGLNGQYNIRGGTAGSGQVQQAVAQEFILTTGATITGVKLNLFKSGSPTDTLNVDLVSTLGGSSLANGTITGADITTSAAWYTITFGTPYVISASTTYYIQLSRTPDTLDATNYFRWSGAELSAAGQFPWIRDNNSWSEFSSSGGTAFQLTGSGFPGFTKLEPQYLLANTLFAAGTALQTFLTDWDSTEWDDGAGSIAYTFQAEAANGSTSDVTLEEADGGGTVTNSTLTNIDNAQISSALTMPTDQNLDTKATTNAGDVAAARILVAYVFAESPPTPAVDPWNGDQLYQLLGAGT